MHFQNENGFAVRFFLIYICCCEQICYTVWRLLLHKYCDLIISKVCTRGFQLKQPQIFIKKMGTIFRRYFYSHRTWDNGFKLKQSTISIETKENFFYEGAMFRFSKILKMPLLKLRCKQDHMPKSVVFMDFI